VLEVALEAGDARLIRGHADQALVLAHRLGAPTSELRAIGCRAVAGLLDGDWPGCDRDLSRTLALSRRFDVPRSLAAVLFTRALLQQFRGDLAAAEATLGEAQRYAALVPQDRHVAGDLALGRCRLAVGRGDRDKVAEFVPTLLHQGGRNVTFRLLTAAQALAFLDRRHEILAVAALLAAGSPDPYRSAMADWAAGLAQLGHPSSPTAAPWLRMAVEGLAGLKLPYWAALARLDLAQATAPADVSATAAATTAATTAARSQAEEALQAFDGLGARRDADRARRLLRLLGARPAPARRPGVAGGPLSSREMQVARLFAEGLTTADVAARLVLSPHTVTAHLRRIYTRLGVHSRAALTRILAEQGLLSPGTQHPPTRPN
jgi:DNA-binding NarL/FixJ family response regulator